MYDPELEGLRMVSVRTASEIMDCSIGHVKNLMARGDLRSIHIGEKSVRITLDSLQKFLSPAAR